MVIWLTGLSGSGKSVYAELLRLRHDFIVLDGDDMRAGLCADLDYSDAGKVENGRRMIELCKMLERQGKDVVVSTITAYNGGYNEDLKRWEGRRWVRRELLGAWIVWVKCSPEICAQRDVKGLYKNPPPNLSGINARWEDPDDCQLVLDTEHHSLAYNTHMLDEFVSRVREGIEKEDVIYAD